jgi:uncharacterized membrane protein (DUF2068 family)
VAAAIPAGYWSFVETPTPRLAPGERLIVLYKLGRALISLAGAVTLGVLFATHRLMAMHLVAYRLIVHHTSVLAIKLAHLLLSAVEPKHVVIALAALAFDSVVLSFEGWSLLHRKPWGKWVVVVATGVPVPLELLALVKHLSVFRLLVLVLNLAIVAYLLARTWRMHHPAAAM